MQGRLDICTEKQVKNTDKDIHILWLWFLRLSAVVCTQVCTIGCTLTSGDWAADENDMQEVKYTLSSTVY